MSDFTIEKISITSAQANKLLPISVIKDALSPNAHVFATFNEQYIVALAVVTFSGDKKHPYVLKFLGVLDDEYTNQGIALVKHIETLCHQTGLLGKFIGDEEYLNEVSTLMEACGYSGKEDNIRLIQYNISDFKLSSLYSTMEKAFPMTKKLVPFHSLSIAEKTAFAKSFGALPLHPANTMCYCANDNIHGVLELSVESENSVYVSNLRIIENDKSAIAILLAYILKKAMELGSDTTISIEASQKGLVHGLIENLGEPKVDTAALVFVKN